MKTRWQFCEVLLQLVCLKSCQNKKLRIYTNTYARYAQETYNIYSIILAVIITRMWDYKIVLLSFFGLSMFLNGLQWKCIALAV